MHYNIMIWLFKQTLKFQIIFSAKQKLYYCQMFPMNVRKMNKFEEALKFHDFAIQINKEDSDYLKEKAITLYKTNFASQYRDNEQLGGIAEILTFRVLIIQQLYEKP